MPRFSIVIPTTRPHYMPGVLASVLAQTFSDFEVIISDNSEGRWSGAAQAAADPRVRIVRPTGYLTVGKHWDFALANASGEWQLLVCDDDALVPAALETIEGAIRDHPGIEAVRWKHASYIHDGAGAGRVAIPTCTGAALRLRSEAVLAEIFAAGTIPGPLKERTPNMPLAACSRALLDRMRAAGDGRIFAFVEPMTSMCMLALACTPEVLVLDRALTVLGASGDSAAGSIRSAGSGGTVFEKTNADSRFHRLPIRSPRILPAWKSEVILELQHAIPERFGRYRFDWASYLWHSYEAMDEMRRDGWDVSPELAMFEAALGEQPAPVRAGVLARIRGHRMRRRLARLRAFAGTLKRRLLGARAATDAAPRFPSIDAAAAHVGRAASA